MLRSFSVVFALLLFSQLSVAEVKKIFILGDSLTEGYGVTSAQAFPQLLNKIIQKKHPQKIQSYWSGSERLHHGQWL